jgi:hypothetical protein
MPKRKPNHIHINGRHYDADTGELLDGQTHRPTPPTPVVIHHAAPTSHVVHHTPKPASPHHAVNHKHAHAPAAAKTLMRHAVKKPGPERRLRAQGHIARQAALSVAPKASAQRLDELRARHARHIRRSQLISHFSAAAVYPVPPPEHHITHPTRKHIQHPATPHNAPKTGLRHHRKPPTTADLLQKALEQATSFRELPVK